MHTTNKNTLEAFVVDHLFIYLLIKFISQHNKRQKNTTTKIKEKILAEWPTQDKTAYVWPIQQNTDSAYTV